MKKRFIRKEYLPSSLWCESSESILLPKILVDSWKSLLIKNDLIGLAKQIASKGFVGGISKEDTDKHLAWRYDGSSARVMLSLLDPLHELNDVSDAYASIFSGNNVFLADIPSGSGAATIAILCTIFELRKHNILPRHPLNITIVAGEISCTARSYFEEQLDYLTQSLEEEAIWIKYETLNWNALDKISTTDLIKKMTIESNNCTSRLLILSNFTGFLERDGKWKQAQQQFDEIFRHSRDLVSTAIWIEPQKKNVENFANRAVTWFRTSFKSLLGQKESAPNNDWYAKTKYQYKQPIKEACFPVRLTVMRFDLPLEKGK